MKKGSKHTEESRKLIKKSHLCIKYENRKKPPTFTEKHRENLRKGLIGNINSLGRTPWNKGRTDLPKQTKEHIEKRVIHMRKEKHPMWKGGISKKKDISKTEWYEKRKEVYKRDNFQCQGDNCKNKNKRMPLDVHHIDDDSNNNVLTNLISLCRSCHVKTTWQIRKQQYANFTCAL